MIAQTVTSQTSGRLHVPPGKLPPAATYAPAHAGGLDGAQEYRGGNPDVGFIEPDGPAAIAWGLALSVLVWAGIIAGALAAVIAFGFFFAAGQTLWVALCGHLLPTFIDYN